MDPVSRYVSHLTRRRLELYCRVALWLGLIEGLGLAVFALVLVAR